jgi:hypothetical protein
MLIERKKLSNKHVTKLTFLTYDSLKTTCSLVQYVFVVFSFLMNAHNRGLTFTLYDFITAPVQAIQGYAFRNEILK